MVVRPEQGQAVVFACGIWFCPAQRLRKTPGRQALPIHQKACIPGQSRVVRYALALPFDSVDGCVAVQVDAFLVYGRNIAIP